MKVKIKRLDKKAVIPQRQRVGDAGLDITAISKHYEKREDGTKVITYGTGIAIQLPENHVGLIFPRSSVSKTALDLCNSVGILDENYTGEIMFKFRLDANARPFQGNTYDIGDRIGQIIIMPYPKVELEEVKELNETERGAEGFGSSGR